MNKETIEQLIDTFLKETEYVANCFYSQLNRKDLVRATRDGTIDRIGKIDGLESYYFHGIGLCAEYKNLVVDFDFGLNDRIDGFDSWRLEQFALSRKLQNEHWTQGKIQSDLDRLESKGRISKLKGDISSNYYKTK